MAIKLTALGWNIWSEYYIPKGWDYNRVIEKSLKPAKCAVALWTKHSIDSFIVKKEVELSLKAGKLISIQVGNVSPPMNYQSFRSVLWKENDRVEEKEFNDLISILKIFLRLLETSIKEENKESAILYKEHLPDNEPLFDLLSEIDLVKCSVFAPPSAQLGHSIIIQVFAHLSWMTNMWKVLQLNLINWPNSGA